MQRYRVNYRLLLTMLVGSFVILVAGFFLWKWQVSRKATWFRDSAEAAHKEGKLEDAFDLMLKYVQLRPKETEPRIELAKYGLEIIDEGKADRETLAKSYQFLEETVRRTGDPELRLELAKKILPYRPQDALGHLEELLSETPNDSELLSMQAQATYKVKGLKPALDLCQRLVGYDQAKDTFDPSKATAKDQPEVYGLLAQLILERDKDKELARRVLDELVAENPESAKAFLTRSVMLRVLGDNAEAQVALDKAFELEPDNADVLLQKGAVLAEDGDLAQAEEVLKAGLEKYPDKKIFFDRLARVQIQAEKLDEALETIEKGTADLSPEQALGFTQMKLDIFNKRGDSTSIKKELDKLSRTENPALEPFIEFYKARIYWRENKWTEAARAFKAVRPRLIDFPQQQAMAGVLLANCYERQGKWDLALQVYSEVLEKYPGFEPAQKGQENARNNLGIAGQADTTSVDQLVDDMNARPKAEQDWSKIDQLLLEIAKNNNLSEARLKVLQANVLIKRGMFPEAEKLIREAAVLDPDDINVRYAAIVFLANNPEKGIDQALVLLDKLVERFGDSPRARSTRAIILKTVNNADTPANLDKVAEGIEQWSTPEQIDILSTVAMQFESLRMYDKAREYWNRSLKIQPDSLPIRTHLFELAFQERNFAAMQDAEKQILDLVGDKLDGDYVRCAVRRTLLEYTQQKASRDDLLAARKTLEQVLKRRPQWHEVHVLYAQVLLVLGVETDLALEHLDEALRYGPANPNAIALQVNLLKNRGSLADARKKIDLIPERMRLQLLGKTEADVLLQTGEKEAAFASAKKVVELEPENPATQLWFAHVASECSEVDAAIAALNKATELQPTEADIWMQLIALYVQQKETEKIDETLRRAQLAVESDYLNLLTGKKYELMGDWRAAEKIYLAAFADRMEEPPICHRMAEFYLLWDKAGKETGPRAYPYINRILRLAHEGKIDANDPAVNWARNRAARIYASTGDYQDALKAQRLLGDAATLQTDEKALLAEILSSRPEPEAQLKAIELLTEMENQGTISKNGVLALARLLTLANRWKEANELMLNQLSTYANDEQIWATFIELLIERGEYVTAASRLDRLHAINPQSPTYFPLSVKLAAARGDQPGLLKLLKSRLPQDLNAALDQSQLNAVLMIARLAAENNQYDLADSLYRLYVRRDPSASLEFIRFLAMHGDPEEALKLCKPMLASEPDKVLSIATSLLRARRAEFGDKYDAQVDEFVAAALRDDPEAVERLMIQAEVQEIEQKYKEAVASYDKLLTRDDMPRLQRAATMNNLGFLLTLLNERTDEAEKLITEAVEVYGPVADILDTRALTRIARKNYDGAVEDMTLATALSTDPMKFYHAALANLRAGNAKAALKAWDRALELGLTKEKLPLMEQNTFDGVKSELEALRTQKA